MAQRRNRLTGTQCWPPRQRLAVEAECYSTSPRTKCYAGGGTFRGGHCVFLRRGQGRTPYVSANRGPIHLISGIEKTQRSHPVPDFLRFLRGLGLGGTGFSNQFSYARCAGRYRFSYPVRFLPQKFSPCTRRARGTQDAVIDFSAKSPKHSHLDGYIFVRSGLPRMRSGRFLIISFSYLYFLIYASKENRRYQFS